MESKVVELVLTCKSWQEAQNAVDALLGNRLVRNAECMVVSAAGTSGERRDVTVIIETLHRDYAAVAAEIAAWGSKHQVLSHSA